ncbi:hypothetical protein GCM10008018_51670 [Paenibacillus marchantiophytorum]|uniref:Uncharacterized protein n=1 Tax=Paenibacillus marchantiophytorum TaxID=1619310 RepID=A0ABQ1F4S0_9BACL|nr:hypothetical protein [Paenibacillus marchantiophytorum]GFZ99150.1 hypothetical protein GCM10008018_51670 [Paenibacillus marchantiophytorum]
MPKYANASAEATAFLSERTGSSQLECFTYIDPEQADNSFFIVKTSNKVIHVSFAEINFDPTNYRSLLEGLYRAIYE